MAQEPKFKPHVGRLFQLRKVKQLEGYSIGRPLFGDGHRILERKKHLGDSVLVLNESNTRVCVTTIDGTAIWIAKYYLLKEIKNGNTKPEDVIEHVVNSLSSLSLYLKGAKLTSDTGECQETKKKEIILQLQDMAKLLRNIS
jgi:hypothetical protein